MVDNYNLISISIQNFRGFEDVVIDFTRKDKPRNIMTFFGHQGSGKSTLVLAIQWCAYGTEFENKDKNLSRRNIYPVDWGDSQKESINVLMKFRPIGLDSNPKDDIQCKRVLSKEGTRDDLEVIDGTEIKSGVEAMDYFRQIFGNIPDVTDGVMWVVRKEEMTRMAQTISAGKSSYFLDFMNLNVPRQGLIELNTANQKKINNLMKNKGNESPNHLQYLNTEIRKHVTRIQKKEKKLYALLL